MGHSLRDNARPLPRRTRLLLPALAGLLIVAGVAVYDARHGPGGIVIGQVLVGAFVTALLGTVAQTWFVAITAIVLAFVSGFWNGDLFEQAYEVRLASVTIGAGLCVVAARRRERVIDDARRFGLLSALAEVADGTRSLQDTSEAIAELLVPDWADVCVIDLPRDEALERITVRAHGPDGENVEAFLAARPPTLPETGVGSLAAIQTGRQQLIQSGEHREHAIAFDDADEARLLALGIRSATVTPLRSRGNPVGVLQLMVTAASGRRYEPGDLAFHQVVSGRVALALDNAGLDRELREAEQQLGVALGTLDEAVTITDPEGHTLYANAAALEFLGFADAEELYATPPDELIARFEVTGEDGLPLTAEMLAARRASAGPAGPPPLIARNVVRETGEVRWIVHRATPILADDGSVARMVNVMENITELKLSELRSKLLADAGEVLASSMDYEHTLQQVAELAVPALADWCSVALPDDRGIVRTVAVAHVDPARVSLARELAASNPQRVDAADGAAQVIRTGTTLCLNEIPDEMLVSAARDEEHLRLLRSLGIRSALTVPMRAGGTVVGALSLVYEQAGAFGPEDVRLAEELGRRAATAVENARVFTERSRITAALQEGLLPDELPAVPGWELAARYQPAGDLNEVGGDFYDVFETPGGWMVVVGDVTGHGAQAAKLTAVARFALRGVAELTGDPLTAVRQLNRTLMSGAEMSLVTLVCVLLGPRDGDTATIDVLRCGHPPPLLVGGGRARAIGGHGPIAGAIADAEWPVSRETIRAGQTLLLYTDGVTDAVGEDDRFGAARLEASAAGGRAGAGALVDRVAGAVAAFSRGPQRDDEALLAVHLPSRVEVGAGAAGGADARGEV